MNIWVAQAAAGVYYLLVGACDMRLASRMQAADADADDDDRPTKARFCEENFHIKLEA